MTDRIARQLSGRRAAELLLPAAALLAASCGASIEPPSDQPTAAAPPPPEMPPPAAAPPLVLPPILLNDPPPPVHTGGEPYPPGTFPPELAPLWENVTGAFQQPGAYWSNLAKACAFELTEYGYVKDQWHFYYEEELADPVAIISAQLREAGVEYESITVRTREYYDERYDPEAFLNWLAPDNDQFDQFAVLERLGGELNPEGSSVSYFGDPPSSDRPLYQVKLHGLSEGAADNVTALPDVYAIEITDRCHADHAHSDRLLRWLVGGLYATYGDDIVWDARVLMKPTPPPGCVQQEVAKLGVEQQFLWGNGCKSMLFNGRDAAYISFTVGVEGDYTITADSPDDLNFIALYSLIWSKLATSTQEDENGRFRFCPQSSARAELSAGEYWLEVVPHDAPPNNGTFTLSMFETDTAFSTSSDEGMAGGIRVIGEAANCQPGLEPEAERSASAP